MDEEEGMEEGAPHDGVLNVCTCVHVCVCACTWYVQISLCCACVFMCVHADLGDFIVGDDGRPISVNRRGGMESEP